MSNKISFLIMGLNFAINPASVVCMFCITQMAKLAETWWTTNFRCELTCYS